LGRGLDVVVVLETLGIEGKEEMVDGAIDLRGISICALGVKDDIVDGPSMVIIPGLDLKVAAWIGDSMNTPMMS
jgi:hypothetical protein